jgi:hypothetical protein
LPKKSSKFCLMKITTLDEDRSNQVSYVNIQIHSKHTLYSQPKQFQLIHSKPTKTHTYIANQNTHLYVSSSMFPKCIFGVKRNKIEQR